jgi:hypothetical protein
VVMQRVQECVWKPSVLPFEATLPMIHNFSVREEDEVVEEDLVVETSQPGFFPARLINELKLYGH